jgi:hypothetical protein
MQLPKVRVTLAGLIAVGAGLVAVGASRPPNAWAAPEGMSTALASAGFHLSAPAANLAVVSDATLKAAIDVARKEFGPAGTAVAAPGSLTVDGYHVGDEHSALALSSRPVIAVQISGLELPPIGGKDMKVTAADMHHELIVFVDANTGQYLLATTIR